LEDYALYTALAAAQPGRSWSAWPDGLAAREPLALTRARSRLAAQLDACRFVQWCFYRQWQALREYAHSKGIRMFGDTPIFVAYDSADVWAHPGLFELDDSGQPVAVAGVPPDYFSATGQRWGNPLYRWEAHAVTGFDWWRRRVRHALDSFDLLRIDHFRGFAAFWRIPAHEETAIHGEWVPGPGEALFHSLTSSLGPLPIVAEDLGTITSATRIYPITMRLTRWSTRARTTTTPPSAGGAISTMRHAATSASIWAPRVTRSIGISSERPVRAWRTRPSCRCRMSSVSMAGTA
jgi:4-alpha-glucanotransferase